MPTINDVAVGDQLPVRIHQASNVSLFMYHAAVWNHHRSHYDEPYATQVEGHAGVVIDGPLQGDWISQVALNWLGDSGRLTSFSYSNRQASHLGDTLISGGEVTSVDPASEAVGLTVWIKNDAGEVVTPGTATVVLDG